MREEQIEKASQPEKFEVKTALSKNWLKIALLAVGAILVVGLSVFAGIQFGKKQGGGVEYPSVTPTPLLSPTFETPTTEPTKVPAQTYKIPQGWLKYSDAEAGITIWYPPQYVAKYNPNRGFGTGNFAAGSYLLDSGGQKILDFYYFAYEGGSRREAFYKTIDWDYTTQEISRHTISASDVSLNNRTFLKLVTNFGAWRDSQYAEKRVFFLTPYGNKMYYFTYPLSVESKAADYKNILTVIATSSLSLGEPSTTKTTYCYPRPDSSNKGAYWDSYIDAEGNMVVIQRTDKALKQQSVDKTKIEISGNPQKIPGTYFTITDFNIYVDSSKKGSYQDAFVIKIKKKDVDKIAADTPPTIPSVAIIISISGGIETTEGEICKFHLYGYYATKP
ncbi:MAG: hypothetical protein ACOZBZ_02770 [Patescibacteria group bacterium]